MSQPCRSIATSAAASTRDPTPYTAILRPLTVRLSDGSAAAAAPFL
jgi:hypothetical protein